MSIWETPPLVQVRDVSETRGVAVWRLCSPAGRGKERTHGLIDVMVAVAAGKKGAF